jgi:hypothetical protein
VFTAGVSTPEAVILNVTQPVDGQQRALAVVFVEVEGD